MIAAIVPCKRLSEAKTRLSAYVSDTGRARLMLALLDRTVAALREAEEVGHIGIATPDPGLAIHFGVSHVAEAEDLNHTLGRAADWATSVGARELLILPADLPLIGAPDVDAFLDSAPPAPAVTIAAAEDGGTGALLLTPPNVIMPAFGEESFQRHVMLAHGAGAKLHTNHISAFRHDLDTVRDLVNFKSYLGSELLSFAE